MLADFLAYVWPALPMFFFAGLCFLLAGALWLFVIRRHELSLGQADAPTYVPPAPARPVLPPHAHIRREDADTQLVARIPGATPLPPGTDGVDYLLGLRQLPAGPELAEFLDAIDADVRVLDLAAGPVCTACGGPFGACTCHIKSAPEETQEIDLCPLTTQDIVIDASAPQFAETFGRHPRAELGTQELSGSVARAKERAA